MDGEIKFSIVVPVYNSAKYLRQCVDAIIGQTYINWELILVDDGSTDESPLICDEYAANSEKIRCVHRKNGGCLQARVSGRKLVTGDYVIQHDSDDYFDSDALEKCYNNLREYDTDCLIINYRMVKNNEIIHDNPTPETIVFKEKYEWLTYLINREYYNGIVIKIVRPGLLDQINYEKYGRINMGEDLLQSLEIYEKSKTIVLTKDVIGNYRRDNEDSITTQDTVENATEKITVYDAVLQLISKEDRYNPKDFSDFLIRFSRLYFGMIGVIVQEKKNWKEILNKLVELKDSDTWNRLFNNICGMEKSLSIHVRGTMRRFVKGRCRSLWMWEKMWSIYKKMK